MKIKKLFFFVLFLILENTPGENNTHYYEKKTYFYIKDKNFFEQSVYTTKGYEPVSGVNSLLLWTISSGSILGATTGLFIGGLGLPFFVFAYLPYTGLKFLYYKYKNKDNQVSKDSESSKDRESSVNKPDEVVKHETI